MRIIQAVYFTLLLFITHSTQAGVPLRDNILFAFEKCKTLNLDVEKGQLKETIEPSFDLHCKKSNEREFKCDYFGASSNKKEKEETFSGDSDLGVAELKSTAGKKIKFLIGKNYATYESGPELKACVGIYLFEQDALKKKSP